MKIQRKKIFKYWQLYLLLLPALIYIAIFAYAPMYGIIIAFKDYMPKKGYWGSDWVGLKHFIRFINYPEFWRLIRNTLSVSLYSLAVFPIPVIMALLINEIGNSKFKKTVQMVTYAPHFMSTVVVCGLVKMLVGREGVLGSLYGLITGQPQDLLTIPQFFSSIYVWSGVWQSTGWSTIIYLSALSGVSPDLIESAKIDGAKRLQVIRYVNVPTIMPTIVIMFIMKVGNVLSVGFDKIFLLQNSLNLDASRVLSTYTYDIGIIAGQFSYSTAIGLFNNVVNIMMIFIANKISNKISGMGIW